MSKEISIVEIQKEINAQLSTPATLKALVDTTFKGLKSDQLVKRALMEGMMRGFKFSDFLEKNVYAIPFKDDYSLVTSIDYARKVGMRSGVCGKSEPVYTDIIEDGKVKGIETCKVTIKRKVGDTVGEYTAKVYFEEYYKKPFKKGDYEIKSLWDTKPRTMIAKVAEMHALRMACPEELAKAYVEEEMEKEVSTFNDDTKINDEILKSVAEAKTVEELKEIYTKHEGLGKEFAKIVSDRKAEITKAKADDKNS